MATEKLTVVLGTLNRLEALKRCVDSILAQTRTPTVVHVTDAGSTDGTVEYLQSIASPQVVPWLVGRKLGQAKAYNDVFKVTETPYVVWLSDDNEIVNNGLDVAVDILESKRRIGMVGLKVRDAIGPFAEAPYIGGVSETGILNVNQGMLRTQVLRDVGYFSETFGFYGIDPDLTAKVLYAGHDIVYTRPVAIRHYRDWAVDPKAPGYAALKANHEKASRLYKAKYGGMGQDDRLWQLKKALWKRIVTKAGKRYQPFSSKPVLGALQRDWKNAFQSRHISALDPILSRDPRYHLRQRARPMTLPPDPSLEAVFGAS